MRDIYRLDNVPNSIKALKAATKTYQSIVNHRKHSMFRTSSNIILISNASIISIAVFRQNRRRDSNAWSTLQWSTMTNIWVAIFYALHNTPLPIMSYKLSTYFPFLANSNTITATNKSTDVWKVKEMHKEVVSYQFYYNMSFSNCFHPCYNAFLHKTKAG